jgi:hypothetical protein
MVLKLKLVEISNKVNRHTKTQAEVRYFAF